MVDLCLFNIDTGTRDCDWNFGIIVFLVAAQKSFWKILIPNPGSSQGLQASRPSEHFND